MWVRAKVKEQRAEIGLKTKKKAKNIFKGFYK